MRELIIKKEAIKRVCIFFLISSDGKVLAYVDSMDSSQDPVLLHQRAVPPPPRKHLLLNLSQPQSHLPNVYFSDLGSVSTMSLLIPHCQSELCHTQDPKAKSSYTMSMLQALHLDIMVWPAPITGANINSSNALGLSLFLNYFASICFLTMLQVQH